MLKLSLFCFFILAILASPIFAQKPYKESCICPANYDPVCAISGVSYITYSNQCAFSCAQRDEPSLTIFNQGPCPEQPQSRAVDGVEPACICTREYRPVCGKFQNTLKSYANKCEFNCAQQSIKGLTLQNEGPCNQE